MNQQRHFSVELLHQQTMIILTGWGMPENIAQETAELMLETDLLGIDSHGISMLPHYDKLRQEGKWHPDAQATVVSQTPVTAVLDGGHALGHATAMTAMKLAIAKSENTGIGAVVVRNSNHFGAAGLYARYAAARGKIALVTSTTRSRMLVPSRAKFPVLGTNPIAFAAPAGEKEDFVLDMATTTVAANKVKVYEFNGSDLPAGWVVNEEGTQVTDSSQGMDYVYRRKEGGLTPLGGLEQSGGHKGYGLAMMAQILAGPLAGAAFAPTREAGGMPNIGHFFLALDPAAFGDPDVFKAELDTIINTLHATPSADPLSPVLVAGEPENQRHRQRQRDGIPVSDALLAQLHALCEREHFVDLLSPVTRT